MKKFATLLIFLAIAPLSLNAGYLKKEQPQDKNAPKITYQKIKEPKKDVADLKKQLADKAKPSEPKAPIINVATKKETPKKERRMTIDKNITEKMITYEKHWYKPRPSTFYVSINGEKCMSLNKKGKLELHNSTFALTPNNTIKARYEWTFAKFGKQWHTEEREIEFSVPEKLDKLDLNFGWDQEYRLSIPQAKMVAWKNIKPPQTNR